MADRRSYSGTPEEVIEDCILDSMIEDAERDDDE